MAGKAGKYQHLTHEFAPVYDANSRILILGSFPSVKSREQQFFYGHPQNRFWKVLAAVLSCRIPQTIQEKKEMLLSHGIALWDVCQSCEREGSLDSNILCEHPNPIVSLLKLTPSIHALAFNGQPAYRLFRRHIEKELIQWCITQDRAMYPLLHLPSTSPAYASMSFAQKLEQWMQLKEFL